MTSSMWTSSGKSTDVFCPDSGLYEPTTPKVGTKFMKNCETNSMSENCFCGRFDFSKFSSYNKALIAKVDQMISEVCIHFIVNNYLWIKWTKWYQRFRFFLSSKIVWNLDEEFKSKYVQGCSSDHESDPCGGYQEEVGGWGAHQGRRLWKGGTITQ